MCGNRTWAPVMVPPGMTRVPCPGSEQYATTAASTLPIEPLGVGEPQTQKSAWKGHSYMSPTSIFFFEKKMATHQGVDDQGLAF
jgi:hypothetical protein